MNNSIYFSELDSPIGKLTLCASDGGLSGVFMESHRTGPDAASNRERADDRLADARRQLGEYFAGERQVFDLELDLGLGTSFQRRVWEALLTVPYGESVSYAEIARRIGQPTAMRAVGLANGRNPVAIIVPCHRVIGANGALTGYGGGLDRKRLLLAHEQRHRLATAAGGLPGSMADRWLL
jgi:methylated-DNA-[protein]-cysteine S-methyltransferase